MNIQNIQRVQLPDGRLVTIEGGSAEQTARFLATNYLGVQQAGPPAQPPPVSHGEEPPLSLPVWNFAPGQRGVSASQPVENSFEEEPLPTPRLTFCLK